MGICYVDKGIKQSCYWHECPHNLWCNWSNANARSNKYYFSAFENKGFKMGSYQAILLTLELAILKVRLYAQKRYKEHRMHYNTNQNSYRE